MKKSPSSLQAEQESLTPVIFTVSSPEVMEKSVHGNFASFLEECHFCKQDISKKSTVFMYGDMRGFCSAECRGKQMTIENFDKSIEIRKGDKNTGGKRERKSSILQDKPSGSRPC
ncbi:hypothetical protein Ddye_018252 [Dipteronia dyeriana]|uniref:FLZ-type domain-containing protein n=1 Tax=Dipteronia dyeriana TaxID=168575 RepID=A0AAD9X1L9_9ROSI|nr:hypothetical protein Ddye_018252 [Dipteronia dyeriana]